MKRTINIDDFIEPLKIFWEHFYFEIFWFWDNFEIIKALVVKWSTYMHTAIILLIRVHVVYILFYKLFIQLYPLIYPYDKWYRFMSYFLNAWHFI